MSDNGDYANDAAAGVAATLSEYSVPALVQNIDIDESWVKFLPDKSVITATVGHFSSAWARSTRVDVHLASGGAKSYFLKLSLGEKGGDLVKGEFESMKMLYALDTGVIPQPIAYGTFKSNPACHFYLSEFIQLIDDVPDIVTLSQSLANLHHRSIPLAPAGQFGFHVTTFNGCVAHDNTWTDSWESYCLRAIKSSLALEAAVQGPSSEIERLAPVIYDDVVPRLLRPMETQGRTLKPCLVHGDFWQGNVAFDAKTGQVYIFDAGAFWGHNEYDLAMCRSDRHKLGASFITEYFKHFPVTPPEEDWEDRTLLYSLMVDIYSSILFPSATKYRELVLATMRQLVEKYQRRSSSDVIL